MRLGILTSHPIQYQTPWFRALAKEVDLKVYFAHRQSAEDQAQAGFGVAFDWDIDLLAGYPSQYLRNVARHPNVNGYAGCDTPEIQELISRESFDAFVVCGWYLKSFLQAVRACHLAKMPVLIRGDSQLGTPQSPFKRIFKEVTHRALLRRFDGFLVVGQRNREYLAHYGVPERKMFSSPHFVDRDWFALRAGEERLRRAEVRNVWGATDQTLVILFVGKFRALKRAGDILDAIALLRQQGTDALPILVGAGEMEAQLRAQATALGIRARFEGFQNQSALPRFYAAADVLVLPSDSETWGLVVNEAMACGLPAVVSEAVGCAPDLIKEAVTGFTFPVGNVAELAKRLMAVTQMKNRGHDFAPALARKSSEYSVDAAVRGTVEAAQVLRKRD